MKIKYTAGDVFLGVLLGMTILLLFFVIITKVFNLQSESYWHKQIIVNNCGQYNQTTGNFEWKEVK